MTQSVSIKPGIAVPLYSGKRIVVEFGGQIDPVPCTCAGLIDNRHIIIRPPTGKSGLLVHFSENVTVVVKYVDSGKIYAFRSVIEHVIVRPYTLLFISHPFSIEEMELRQEQRCPCFIPMNCRVEKGGAELYGYIVDLNRHGCRFVATSTVGDPGLMAQNDIVSLNFEISRIEVANLPCSLKSICCDESHGVFGVKFEGLSEHAALVIDDFVKNYKTAMEVQEQLSRSTDASCKL